MSPSQQLSERGLAVVRRVFDAAQIAALAREFDRVERTGGLGDGLSEVRRCYGLDPRHGRVLRFVQRSGWLDDSARAWCCRPELLRLLRGLLGPDLKVVVNTLFYKRPGVSIDHIGFHQDWRFRKPGSAYRDLARAYLQVAVAVDAQGPRSGGLLFYPGSHRLGDLRLYESGGVSLAAPDHALLRARGLDPSRLVALELAPGDVAIWNPYLVHGSESNRSTAPRRSFVVGYVRSDCADVGDRIPPGPSTSGSS